MFDKILGKNQPTESQLEVDYQTQIDKLQAQSYNLHSQIMASGAVLTKAKQNLIAERGHVTTKISHLQALKDHQSDMKAIPKIDALFRKTMNEYTFLLMVNNRRTKINRDLMIELKFQECGHTKLMHVKHIIKSPPRTFLQIYLLAKWQATLNTSTTLTTSFNCEECRIAFEHKEKRTQRLRSPDDRVGACTISLGIK